MSQPGTSIQIFDVRGLSLHVMPAGGRYWRFNYRLNDRHKTLALGIYPDVPLREPPADCGGTIGTDVSRPGSLRAQDPVP